MLHYAYFLKVLIFKIAISVSKASLTRHWKFLSFCRRRCLRPVCPFFPVHRFWLSFRSSFCSHPFVTGEGTSYKPVISSMGFLIFFQKNFSAQRNPAREQQNKKSYLIDFQNYINNVLKGLLCCLFLKKFLLSFCILKKIALPCAFFSVFHPDFSKKLARNS